LERDIGALVGAIENRRHTKEGLEMGAVDGFKIKGFAHRM